MELTRVELTRWGSEHEAGPDLGISNPHMQGWLARFVELYSPAPAQKHWEEGQLSLAAESIKLSVMCFSCPASRQMHLTRTQNTRLQVVRKAQVCIFNGHVTQPRVCTFGLKPDTLQA